MHISKPFILVLLIAAAGCQNEQTESAYHNLGLQEITIPELQDGYENGDFTVADVTRAYLNRIENIDQNGPELNSIITVNSKAMERARQLDDEREKGNNRGPLHGVAVVLKDNIDTEDMATTAGAHIMEGSVPPDDASITKKLRQAGAVILGKANLSEWANFHSSFSSSGWSGLGGQTKNPYDLSRNPCGSSSGPGAAVSANLTMFGIGTETNGSIVCPSSANGIVGIKPTVGLLSRDGIIPISFTQDTPGPMARTVTDAAVALGSMVGIDSADTKTAQSEVHYYTNYTQFLNEDGLQGKRIGFWTEPMGSHFRVDSLMQQNIDFLKEQGATIVKVDQIEEENIGGDSFQVLLYEFKDGLNNYLKSLGDEAPVNNFSELVDSTLADSVEMQYFDHDLLIQANGKGDLESEEYTKALKRMQKYARAEGIDRVMEQHNLDAIVAPTGAPAWKTDLTNGDNFSVSSSSPAAHAGYPNITVPMGYIDGLPVGISFFGRAWSEPILIEIAYAFEQASDVRKAPKLENSNRN